MKEVEALFCRFKEEGTARYFVQLAGCVDMNDMEKAAEFINLLGDVEAMFESACDETANTKSITVWRTQV